MKYGCKATGCRVAREAHEMCVPEWEAVRRANGGKHVAADNLPEYVLCWRHGRMLQKEGVRVMPFDRVFASAKAQEERKHAAREAERLRFQPFANRFLPKRLGSEVEDGTSRPANA